MFALKQALLSAALFVALTVPTQASTPMDEDDDKNNALTSTHATTSTSLTTPAAPWDTGISNAAKEENANNPLMSLTIWPLQQICQILEENGDADTIATLGQVSIHLASRILRKMGEYDHPTIRQAIRVDLQASIRGAREKALMILQKEREDQSEDESEDQSEDQSEVAILEPWEELLGENASLQHLIWARQMLRPDNVERLVKEGLLEELTRYKNTVKTLALGAAAPQIFTERMDGDDQTVIIYAALRSSRPLSEYAALGTACKENFFTKGMNGENQAVIIRAALDSSLPLSKYAALGAACKAHLFTEGMNRENQTNIIRIALASSRPLSDYSVLGSACKHFFTEKMSVRDQALIIEAALDSSLPLSKYVALGAACKQYLFTEKMDGGDQARIIRAALDSSRPLSDYAALGAVFKTHLFAEKMNGNIQALIITAALTSARPLSEYAALITICKAHLFTEKMSQENHMQIIQAAFKSTLPLSEFATRGAICKEKLFRPKMTEDARTWIISTFLLLSHAQVAQLVHEYTAREWNQTDNELNFLFRRATELLAGK